jgi:CheY-like chemotaxis protein
MMKVLVVDDDEAIRTTLVEFLTDEGFLVSSACDGQEALDVLAREPGYIVLLDIFMPKLDGYGVIRWLESAQRLDHHQIVVLSATRRTEPLRALLQSGKIAAFLQKPFEIDDVLALVNQLAA